MKNRFSRFFVALAAVLTVLFFNSSTHFAQSRQDVFALTNVRIVTVSSAPIDKGTVVIRNGLIENVGANVNIPADAKIIDGNGLTVYPGFFDAHSNAGIPAVQRGPQGPGQQQIQQQTQQTQNQSNSTYPAGLQPEISAMDLIRAGDGSLETARNNGLTTVLSVPRERIFVGQSALINTAGDSTAQMVLRSPVALHIAFVPLQSGAYPASLLGTFSALRQMFLDAGRLQRWQKQYEANPRGVKRPDADKSLEALFPALNREMPVVMLANSEREIVRAIDLAKEFNLKAMIGGGFEAGTLASRLKASDIPVLLSLNFPKRTTASSPDSDPESLETLRLRVEVLKTAAKLKQAGVRFAFQSGGMTNPADFLTNAGKTVENGLSKDDALRAMTLGSAEIFGVADRLGSIENGKIANLVVVRGDVFDKNKAITHVFVDGKLYEQKPQPRPEERRTPNNTTVPTATLNGTWTMNIDVPGQPITATAVLVQQDKKLTGTVETPFGKSEIQSGEVTGDGFSFKIQTNVGGDVLEVTFAGKFTGNQMSGTATAPQGAAPFTGTKNP